MQRYFAKVRLTAPWLVLLGLLVALGILASGAVLIDRLRTDAWRAAEKSSASLMGDLTRDLTRNITLYDSSLQGIRQIMEQPDINRLSPETRHMALFNRTATSEYLGPMLVLDANGSVVADTRSAHPAPVNMADRDFFLAHRDRSDVGLFISRAYRSRLRQGDWSVAIGRRISRPDGSFGGIVSGALRLAYFQNIFGEPDIGPNGTILLFRGDGRVIVRLPFQDAQIDQDWRDDPLFRQFAAASTGTVIARAGDDGIERLYKFSRVADLPLILAVGIALQDVHATWSRMACAIGVVLTVLAGATLALSWVFSRALRRKSAAEQAMRQAAGEWEAIAGTDALTELANRRAFDATLVQEWRRAIRGKSPIALLMIDADHFKRYNDHYGHPMGDQVLRGIASCIKRALLRPGDLGCRIGGEEFAVLLQGTDRPGAVAVAERIIQGLALLAMPHAENPGGRVTVSIGVAVVLPAMGDPEAALVAKADKALYAAKTGGRNRVSVDLEDASPLSGDEVGEPVG